MSSILTNNGAMVALQTLKGINKNMGQIQNEISTGKTVATAKDNAAIWAISKVMESDVSGFKGISDALGIGAATVSVGSAAASKVVTTLKDMRNSIIAAQSGSITRATLQDGIEKGIKAIQTAVDSAQYNGVSLVKGSDDINVLASLNRSSDGSVSASQIAVSRNDLTTSAGKVGTNTTGVTITAYGSITPPGATPTAAATGTTTAAVGKNAIITVGAATATGNNYSLNINGKSINYTTNGAKTDAEMAEYLAGAVNALGLEGVSASFTAGALTISNTNAFEAMEISTQGSQLTRGNVNGFAYNATTNNIVEQRAEAINFSTTAAPADGDSFTVGIAGKTYSYVAGKGETMEDVARGLKTAIDSEATPGIKTAVQKNETTGQWSLAIDDATGGRALSLAVAKGGEASGGLFGLDKIDVSTDEGAQAALENIETFLSAALNAGSAFGAAEKQIDSQADFIGKLSDALKSGIGVMVDADMEEASARLQALQVQQQLGVQSLSIANQAPQSILSLFR